MKKMLTIALIGIFLSAIAVSAHGVYEMETPAKVAVLGAQAAYDIALDDYKNSKVDWIAARDAYKTSRGSDKQVAAIEKSQTFLLRFVSVATAHLEFVKARIAGSEILENTEELTASLDEKIKEIEGSKAQIESSASIPEIRALGKNLKTMWLEAKALRRRVLGNAVSARVLWVVERAESGVEKVQEKINELKSDGKNTEVLETLLTDYKRLLEEAKEKYSLAKEKFASITYPGSIDESVQEGNALIKEAKEKLLDAHKILKDIVLAYREARGESPESTTTTTLEEETTTTVDTTTTTEAV